MAKNVILETLRQIDQQLATTKKRFQIAMKGKSGRLALKALAKLKRIPGAPVYPLRWQTEKQRRAYFATDGFGSGIPYRRTGELVEGWDVEVANVDDGVLVALTNPAPETEFVQGFRVQDFHLDTGWVQVADVTEDFYAEVDDGVVSVWYPIADPLEAS
jgi:hypothetical protein